MADPENTADVEAKARADAQNGSDPDPAGDQYYLNAYNNYKKNNPPPEPEKY